MSRINYEQIVERDRTTNRMDLILSEEMLIQDRSHQTDINRRSRRCTNRETQTSNFKTDTGNERVVGDFSPS